MALEQAGDGAAAEARYVRALAKRADDPRAWALLARAQHRRRALDDAIASYRRDDHHARRQGRAVLPISERSLRRLLTYDWPGNVRELENTVERATVLADEDDTELEIELPQGPSPVDRAWILSSTRWTSFSM